MLPPGSLLQSAVSAGAVRNARCLAAYIKQACHACCARHLVGLDRCRQIAFHMTTHIQTKCAAQGRALEQERVKAQQKGTRLYRGL